MWSADPWIGFSKDSTLDSSGATVLSQQMSLIKTAENVETKPTSRARITEADVLKIYSDKGSGLSASKICQQFGISEKAVRDIWKGRTWAREIARLDPSSSFLVKKLGRPIGSKDKIPRKKPTIQTRLETSKAADSNSGSRFLQKKSGKLHLLLEGANYHDEPTSIISIDAQIHEWNRRGCWIDTNIPSFDIFFNNLFADQ